MRLDSGINLNRQDTWFRKSASRMINRLIQRTTGKAMGDYGCMLRAYRRHIIDAMLNCHERSTFIPILANTFARRAVEIPVMHAEREFGDSKYSFMRLINLMYDLVTCLTTTPLRLLSLFGSAIALLGFAFGLLLVVLRLVFGPQWAAEGLTAKVIGEIESIATLTAAIASGMGVTVLPESAARSLCGAANGWMARITSPSMNLSLSLNMSARGSLSPQAQAVKEILMSLVSSPALDNRELQLVS